MKELKVRTLIVDDEPHAVALIKKYAAEFAELEIVSTCHSALQALHFLQDESIDLVFLDIKMPGISGIDLIKSLPLPPKVIFTTAYQEYAVEGFDLNAVDYLLKPISFERFFKAAGKVICLFKGQMAISPAIAELPATTTMPHYLHLRIDRKIMKINTKDICWIESDKDYVKVVLKDRTLTAKQKISVIEQLLPIDAFMRIHRSFIVPVDRVEAYHANSVQVAGKTFTIGRQYKSACQTRLQS
ncbi:LytR/AlgR family response regulator transcription factor [Mucilaginibacter auburnensis]|nr:LytTR family DNA-binding domain-containing protein [Mucilaginibacter auburnensis]